MKFISTGLVNKKTESRIKKLKKQFVIMTRNLQKSVFIIKSLLSLFYFSGFVNLSSCQEELKNE